MNARKTPVLFFLTMLLAASAVAAQDAIPWVRDLNQAKEIAARENKLVLVHFWSQSCAPCLELDRYVFRNAEVGNEVGKNYVPVKVNVAEHPDLARQFDIREIPKDVILTASGRELERRTSPSNANGYIQLMAGAAERAATGGQRATQELAQAAREAQQNSDGGHFDARQSGYDDAGYDPRTGKFQSRTDSGQPGFRQDNQPAPNNPWDDYAGDGYKNPGANTGANPAMNQQRDRSAASSGDRSRVIYNEYGDSRDGARSQTQNQSSELGQRNEFDPRGNYSSNSRGGFDDSQRPRDDWSAGNQVQGKAETGMYADRRPAAESRVAESRVAENREPYPAGVSADPYRSAAPSQSASPPAKPPIGLDGYCPVSLVESPDPRQAWRKGDPTWGAVHRGRLYFFTSRENQQRFMTEPDKYAPGLSCYDPVLFVDNNQLVDGVRSHGVSFRGQVFLFSDESSLRAFWQDPSRYTTVVRQAMQQNRDRGTLQR